MTNYLTTDIIELIKKKSNVKANFKAIVNQKAKMNIQYTQCQVTTSEKNLSRLKLQDLLHRQ
jgi:glutaredoxin-related protein